MIAVRHSLDDARIVHKEAMSLVQAGHSVVLLLSCDNNGAFRRFDGQVVARIEAGANDATYMGLTVIGVRKRRGLGKIAQFREFVRRAVELSADALHVHEPDMALAAAIRAKKILQRRGRAPLLVHDMHEYPPGGAVDSARPRLRGAVHALRVLWDKRCAKYVDHVITANAIVRGYALLLAPATPVDIVYNAPSLGLFAPPSPTPWRPPEPLRLVHEGSLGFGRGLKEMVAAVRRMNGRVTLKIVGDVFGAERDWLEGELRQGALSQWISWTGWLPYKDVGAALHGAHVGLILFRAKLNNQLAGPPNKLFNYMNAGLPLISVGFPELRRVILEAKCGVLVADQSVEAIVSAIEELMASGPNQLFEMARAGQAAVRAQYSWEKVEESLLRPYGRVRSK